MSSEDLGVAASPPCHATPVVVKEDVASARLLAVSFGASV
jgi:hypothetical protein